MSLKPNGEQPKLLTSINHRAQFLQRGSAYRVRLHSGDAAVSLAGLEF